MPNTTVTLRPRAILSNTAWTPQPGGTLNGNTLDNSDATWAQLNAFPGTGLKYLSLLVDTIVLPPLAIIKSVTARVRAETSANLPVWFGASVDWLSAPSETFLQDGVVRTVSGVARTTKVNGSPWDYDDLLHLYIEMEANGSYLDQDVYWYEAYVDVAYNQAPTCTVNLPTGVITTTNTPTVTWTFSDPDGDVQTKYRVKIFSAADYGVGGFNPETYPAQWDSGEVASAAASVVVGVPLTAGVTFKAYVRVHDGNQWSAAWVSGPTFSVLASGVDKPGRVFFATSAISPSSVGGYFEFDDTKRGGSYIWKSAPVRSPDGRQVEIREVQVYCRTYDANATVTVTVGTSTKTNTIAIPSRQQLTYLFRERGEVLDVRLVVSAGTPATYEAPSVEVVRIGWRPLHMLRGGNELILPNVDPSWLVLEAGGALKTESGGTILTEGS